MKTATHHFTLTEETLAFLERAGVQPERIRAMRETIVRQDTREVVASYIAPELSSPFTAAWHG